MAAGAVNRLVRAEKRGTTTLLEAGERLREVQGELARGSGDAGQLRQASEEERRAVSALVEGAGGSAGGERLSETVLERVRDTLHASTLDEETRRAVEAGRLTQEAAAVGFGALAGDVAAPPPRKGSPARGDRPKKQEDRSKRSAKREEQRAAERAAREELGRLEASVKEERKAVSAAGKAVREHTRDRDRLQKRLEKAQAELDRSEGRLERADGEAKDARRRLAELRKARSG